MRSVVACAVLAGCSFIGPPISNAPSSTAPDAPPLILIDAAPMQAADAPALIQDALPGPDATIQPTAFRDCLDAYQAGIHTDGPQQIDPDGAGGHAPFTAFCNMTKAGGGWTLAYAYRFVDPQNFTQGSNAITPRPSWPITSTTDNVATSTTPPSSELDPNAIDFAVWPKLGPVFLVTSNINNSISCTPTSGGLTAFTDGGLACTVVQPIANLCQTTVPTQLTIRGSGALLHGFSIFNAYYYFENVTTDGGDWPTHDPCGSNSAYSFQLSANARGAIYLRRQ